MTENEKKIEGIKANRLVAKSRILQNYEGNSVDILRTKLYLEDTAILISEYDRLKKENEQLLALSSNLDEHPEGYEGPCLCRMCQSYG